MCDHKKTILEVTGGIYFYGGDVVDTTKERLICQDCGQEVDEPETETEMPEVDF